MRRCLRLSANAGTLASVIVATRDESPTVRPLIVKPEPQGMTTVQAAVDAMTQKAAGALTPDLLQELDRRIYAASL